MPNIIFTIILYIYIYIVKVKIPSWLQPLITCALWEYTVESLKLDRRPLEPSALVAFYLILSTLFPTVHT